MKITKQELALLRTARATKHDALAALHRAAHIIVCENQDDRCTVTKPVADLLIALAEQAPYVRRTEREIFALALVDFENQVDAFYFAVQLQPENDRYEVVSASDCAKYLLEVID